jgi:hypothetical protein
MADIEPDNRPISHPQFDPKSIIASEAPMILDENRLSIGEMAAFATMVSEIRVSVLEKAMANEQEIGQNEETSTPWRERLL